MVQQIAQSGLLARLRPDQPIDLLLEIGDALLASPVLVVELPMEHPDVAMAIEAFRERFGDHLLVGVGGVASVEQGALALSAGAQFLTTTRYTTELHHLADRCGALYIPPATAPAALPVLLQMNILAVTVPAQMLLSQSSIVAPPPAIIMENATPEMLSACARANGTAVAIGHLLFPTIQWSMAPMIRMARNLRQLWMAGRD